MCDSTLFHRSWRRLRAPGTVKQRWKSCCGRKSGSLWEWMSGTRSCWAHLQCELNQTAAVGAFSSSRHPLTSVCYSSYSCRRRQWRTANFVFATPHRYRRQSWTSRLDFCWQVTLRSYLFWRRRRMYVRCLTPARSELMSAFASHRRSPKGQQFLKIRLRNFWFTLGHESASLLFGRSHWVGSGQQGQWWNQRRVGSLWWVATFPRWRWWDQHSLITRLSWFPWPWRHELAWPRTCSDGQFLSIGLIFLWLDCHVQCIGFECLPSSARTAGRRSHGWICLRRFARFACRLSLFLPCPDWQR